jgi:heat shock protein HslJ
MRRWLMPAVMATLLAAGGCGGDAGRASRGTDDVRRDSSAPSLTQTEWQLTGVVGPARTWTPPPEVDAVLRLDGDGGLSATVCNQFSGSVRIDGNVLSLAGQLVGTDAGCSGPEGEVEAAFIAVMDGEVRWAISGEELRLDKPDGRGLRLRPRATIYPSRVLQPLLQGRRDGGDYRFGWHADKTGIGLEFEWRDGPGKLWGLVSISQPPASQGFGGDRLRQRRARAGTVGPAHVLTSLGCDTDQRHR